MKRTITLFLAAALLFALLLGAGETGLAEEGREGRQVATAWLDQAGSEIGVSVELTGGWSVEFAHGALYLYDGDYSEDDEDVAFGLTLEEEGFAEAEA